MGRGQKVREGGAGDLEQEAARKIVRDIQTWRDGHKIPIAQKRWLFELIQNAIDVSRSQNKEKLIIELKSTPDSITVKHNAGYFSEREYRALIEAYSTKPFERDSDFAGRFATGFLVTHIVDKVVNVKGILIEECNFLQFSTEIDRSSEDIEIIRHNFDKAFDALDAAIPINNPPPADFWTEYTYHIKDDIAKEAVNVGVTELKKCIPFLLVFNKIDSIIINGEEYSASKPEKISDEILVQSIEAKNVWYTHGEKGSVGLIINSNTNQVESLSGIPRIYVHGLPLIESGIYFNIPFVLHSQLFETTDDRDFLKNTTRNQEILREAFILYYRLAELISKPSETSIQELHFLADFHPIQENESFKSELLQYSNLLIKDTLKNIIDNLSFVETVGKGTVTIAKALFPTQRIKDKQLPDDDFSKFYVILQTIKKEIPTEKILTNWARLTETLKKEFGDLININFYSMENLKINLETFRNAQQNLPNLGDIAKEYGLSDAKEAKDFLLSFLGLINELTEKGVVDDHHFIDNLVLDQDGNIGPYNWGDLGFYRDKSIPEELKEIATQIGWNIRQNLLDDDFAAFKIVTDLVNKELTSEVTIKLIMEKHPLMGKLDEDPTKWPGAVNGWVNLFRWCITYQKLPEGFFIITKDSQEHRIQKITNLDNEYFIIPFKFIEINETFEKIYPESRILHNKYFECENASQLIQALNYKVIVKKLPTVNNISKIEHEQLSSFLVSENNMSNSSNEIVTQESKLSVLPFWQFVMRRVSRNQNLARILFEFVIKNLIVKDSQWKKEVVIECSCSAQKHSIVSSQWLADLVIDSWLPVEVKGTDGVKTIASNKATKEGLENLFTVDEIDQFILGNPEDVTRLLTYFHFDELDIKVKLQSIKKKISEKEVKKEVSSLIDISNELPSLIDIYNRDSKELKKAIEKVKASLDLQPTKDENKIIGENVEQIIEKFLEDEKYGFEPKTVGSDIEIWPEGAGWDAGAVALLHYWMEIKFTSTEKARVSDAQGKLAREKKQNFTVLVVENKNNLRDSLKAKLDKVDITPSLTKEIMDNSHVIEDFYLKIGSLPNPAEVEADINGYWVRKKLWGSREPLSEWIKHVFNVTKNNISSNSIELADDN